MNKIISVIFVCSAISFAPSVALATSATTRTPELAAGSVAVQVLTGLGFVTVAILVLGWLVKYAGGGRLMQNSSLSIIATIPVGSREKVVLLTVEKTKVLVGVTSNNISSLHVFDEVTNNSDGSVPRKRPEQRENDDTSLKNLITESAKKSRWDFSHYVKQLSQLPQRKIGAENFDLSEVDRPSSDRNTPAEPAESHKDNGKKRKC